MKHKFPGEEIFLILAEGVDCKGYIEEAVSLSDANQVLAALDPNGDSETLVLHGHMTSALFLPPSTGDCNIYIILTEHLNPATAEVITFEGDTINDLADEVQGIVTNGTQLSPFITIDEVRIVYGYEAELGLTIDEDNIEEEAIDEIVACISEED